MYAIWKSVEVHEEQNTYRLEMESSAIQLYAVTCLCH